MLPIIRIKITIKIIFIIDIFLLHTDLLRSNNLHFNKVSSVSYEQIRVAFFLLHTDLLRSNNLRFKNVSSVSYEQIRVAIFYSTQICSGLTTFALKFEIRCHFKDDSPKFTNRPTFLLMALK